MVLAVASGTDTPQQMRSQGAATVLFDLNFNKRVGTTANPADPATLDAKAKALLDYATSVTGCPTPMIAENELFGAQTPTPWSPTNGQYRSNVLQFLTALGTRWNVSMFHYRNHGAAFGRVLCGLEVALAEREELRARLDGLGFEHAEATDNPAGRFFLR